MAGGVVCGVVRGVGWGGGRGVVGVGWWPWSGGRQCAACTVCRGVRRSANPNQVCEEATWAPKVALCVITARRAGHCRRGAARASSSAVAVMVESGGAPAGVEGRGEVELGAGGVGGGNVRHALSSGAGRAPLLTRILSRVEAISRAPHSTQRGGGAEGSCRDGMLIDHRRGSASGHTEARGRWDPRDPRRAEAPRATPAPPPRRRRAGGLLHAPRRREVRISGDGTSAVCGVAAPRR